MNDDFCRMALKCSLQGGSRKSSSQGSRDAVSSRQGCRGSAMQRRGLAARISATAVVAKSNETAQRLSSLSVPSSSMPSLRPSTADELADDLPAHGFDSIESAIKALAQGEMVVVLDDEKRENEGDLIMAAEKVTVQKPSCMHFPVRMEQFFGDKNRRSLTPTEPCHMLLILY